VSHIVDAHVAYIKAIADLSRDKVELLERIKRLEEAGDALHEGWLGYGFTKDRHLAAWRKAKEAKP
jgi:hypothetical protein